VSAPAGLDPASIPERIQSEVQRAIQRSIKGVEYIAFRARARFDAERSTTSSCLGTMWRRSGHRWRPTGFRELCSGN
jgi:hypothetical protein